MSAFTLNKITDNETRATFVCTGVFTTTTQETNVVKVDGVSLANYNSAASGTPGPAILSIRRVLYSISSGACVQVIFDGGTPSTALVLTGTGEMDLQAKGLSIKNNATTPNGKILFTTLAFAANGSYSIVLEVSKVSGY